MSVISVGRNGSAVVPCRLGLGCRPELGFSSSSLTHARRVTPAHTLTHTHALLHLPTHSFCRYTRHTYTNTHLIPVSAAVHTVRLQLVSTPLRFLVAGLSANIIPLVWTGLNRTVRVFVCIRVFVCVHVSLCQSMWAVLVVILWFSMHMCGQVWFCACEPRGGRGGVSVARHSFITRVWRSVSRDYRAALWMSNLLSLASPVFVSKWIG